MAANLGKVMITTEGKYVTGIRYREKSIVMYKGNTYISLKDTAEEPADDGVNWMMLLEGVPIATSDTVGKSKPDGETITIDEDGTLHGASQVPEGVTFVDLESSGEALPEKVPVNADQLGGQNPEYYATANDINKLKSEIINENLLKNSNFKLNTNGSSEYVGADAYAVNEWFLHQGTTLTVLDEGVTLVSDGDETNYWMISQSIENWSDYIGKTVTYSVKYANYSGGTVRLNVYDGVSESATVLTNGNGVATVRHTVKDNATRLTVMLTKDMGIILSIDVKHVKLELGLIATEYVEPDMEIEKVRCGVADYLKQETETTNAKETKFLVDTLGHFMLFIRYKDDSIKLLKLWNDRNEATVDVYNPITNEWSSRTLAFVDSVLPLTGGTLENQLGVKEVGDTTATSFLVTGNAGCTHLVNHTNADGKRRQFTIVPYAHDSDFRHALRYDYSDNGEWRSETVLHTGNSKPVEVSSTAPTDTTALWYNPSTKAVKSYIDGAWT